MDQPLSNVDYLIKFRSGDAAAVVEASPSSAPRSGAGIASSASFAAPIDPLERAVQGFGRMMLKFLNDEPNRTSDVYTLIDRMGFDISALLPVLEYLEAQQLVRVDRSDRRGNYVVTLTDAGSGAIHQAALVR